MIDIDAKLNIIVGLLDLKINNKKKLLENLITVNEKINNLKVYQKSEKMVEVKKPEIIGILFKIPELLTTQSGFKKQDFIIKTDEVHPQYIKLELHNDKCELINQYVIGEKLKIFFNIRGKQWISPIEKEVYFTSFVAWKIKKIENGYVVPTEEHKQLIMNLPDPKDVFGDSVDFKGNKYEDDDDLPF